MLGRVQTVAERLAPATTPRQVIRAVRALMRPAARRDASYRERRKEIYRQALDHFAYWRGLLERNGHGA